MNIINRTISGILLIIFLASCSTDRLNNYAELCICEVTEHYSISTDNEENSIKEFSFTGSPIFDFNVPRYDFALSMAIQINHDLQIDSLALIKISINKNSDSDDETISYEFDYYELKRTSPKYFEIKDFISSFVENSYNEEYQECRRMVEIDIEDKEFNSIMNNVKNGLEQNYISTRIVSYKKAKGGIYKIYGGIWTENETLDLFRMQLKDTEKGIQIIEFEF